MQVPPRLGVACFSGPKMVKKNQLLLLVLNSQMHWSTIEREAFAVIWALKRFRSWIFLSKIIIYSDHNTLSYLTDASPQERDERIREYCASCQICQLRTPVKVADRVPITPIPRADELCYNHLNMDCIGPMVVTGESNQSKPKYNYALVLVDKFSRWPMAYPLRSLNAKGVCEALLQVFTTFSIPRIISSDCGTNFTSRLTKEFLQRMGCSP